MSSSFGRPRRRVAGLLLFFAASCGARSGLFGPEAAEGPGALDGSTDAPDSATSRDGPTDAPAEATPCIPGRFDFELATPQLMFVIDRSGSMRNGLTTDQPATPSRWTTLQGSLTEALLPFDSQIAMGAKFFPESLADTPSAYTGCFLDPANFVFPPQTNNASAILGVFQTRLPNGGTPTSEAVRVAADVLGARRGVARSLVVATDGAPNCNDALNKNTCTCTSPNGCSGNNGTAENCLDDARTIATVREIADVRKIPVYVVGIGAEVSAAYASTLDAMAVAGGRPRPTPPRYYSAQSSAELTGALGAIRDSLAKCTYLTPSAPTDPNSISVTVGGASVPRDPTRTNGWDWVDQQYGQLTFFGDACTALSGEGGTVSVSGVVRCE